jgi:hypothetical protein
MASIDDHLEKARIKYNANEMEAAFASLWRAVRALDEREKRRAEFANRLLAETMFAVVRLEIAQGTDQIINNALAVKRDVTGSGTAEFAVNVTATLVMLAGNVLSGGGMSLLGNLLVAAGEMAKGAAKNDIEGTARGALKMAGAATTAGISGRLEFDKQHEGYKFADRKDIVQEGGESKAEVRNHAEGVGELVNKSGEGAADLVKEVFERYQSVTGRGEVETPEAYKVTRRRTVWIPHGAGGTQAITTDVQEAIDQAYANALTTVVQEFGILGQSDGTQLPPNSILGQIVSSTLDPTAKMHPITNRVLSDAIGILKASGGHKYRALTGGSGMFGRESVLNEAKAKVKKAYENMWDSGTIASIELVRQKVNAP